MEDHLSASAPTMAQEPQREYEQEGKKENMTVGHQENTRSNGKAYEEQAHVTALPGTYLIVSVRGIGIGRGCNSGNRRRSTPPHWWGRSPSSILRAESWVSAVRHRRPCSALAKPRLTM